MPHVPKPDGDRSGRKWSNALWSDCPWQAIKDDPGLGYCWFEDFLNVDVGAWTVTNLTSGTMAPIAGAYGIAQLSAGAATDGQGVADANPGDSAGGYILLTSSTTLWWECLVRPTVVGHGNMIGLATHGEGLASTGEPNGTDRIHFNTDDAASILFNYKDGDGSEYEVDTGIDFVTTEWIKLGFKVNGLSTAEYYVNSVKLGTVSAAAEGKDLPNAVMSPVWAVIANGSTTPLFDCDWVRLAVLDESSGIVSV